MGAKGHVNLSMFTVALLTVLTMRCSYLQRNKSPSNVLSTMDKRVIITFHQNQRLNLGNQYNKDVKYVASEFFIFLYISDYIFTLHFT